MNVTKTQYFIICIFTGMMLFHIANAQELTTDSSEVYEISPVELTASRWKELNTRSHLAISSISKDKIQRGQQQLSFNESLNYIPGLFALNPGNFAQDLRVSIRGFGARAAFGIRGIKLLVDGIPETTPDGQAQVDNLDIGLAERVEVVRGPASGLYGNASGGVISVTTEEPTEDPFTELRLSWGSFGFQRYQLKTGQQLDKFSYIVHGSYTASNGYREHSEMENYLFNGKFGYQFDSLSTLTLLLNYVDSPLSNDPGGINLDDVNEDRRQARLRNVVFDGGEELTQGKVGLVYNRDIHPQHSIQIKLYHIFRDFANRLPFESGGIVQFDRSFTGGGAWYQYTGNFLSVPYRLLSGVDIEWQGDDRARFNNLEGETGERVFDQKEIFQNIGVFVKQQWDLTQFFSLSANLRFDNIRIEAEDSFLSDGDDSGTQDLQAISPMAGIVYSPREELSIYANVATSFETPTLSELSNNPTGGGGFNDDLEPQRANNYEIGVKGIINATFAYELALFHINVNDELVPFELEAFPGRNFFRNAGESRRNGLELLLNYRIKPGLTTYLTYTFSDFVYTDYETTEGNFADNRLPGIPKHMLFSEIRYQKNEGWYGLIQMRYNSPLYADDANETLDSGYIVANVRTGFLKKLNTIILEPFLGINNITDSQYTANIRINAFGGRYYEPAEGISIFGGLRVRWGK